MTKQEEPREPITRIVSVIARQHFVRGKVDWEFEIDYPDDVSDYEAAAMLEVAYHRQNHFVCPGLYGDPFRELPSDDDE